MALKTVTKIITPPQMSKRVVIVPVGKAYFQSSGKSIGPSFPGRRHKAMVSVVAGVSSGLAPNHNMDKEGATSCLLVHIVVRGTSTRALRSFSVTEDFEPGGQPHHFAQMEPETRAAIEQTWREIEYADRTSFDPAHAVFSLMKTRKLVGASGWENYVLIFQCNHRKFLPPDPRAPMILCHLSKDLATNEISMKHEFMISQNCELGALQGSYDWLEGDWRGVAKDQMARINNYDQNITKHPWALKKMYRTVGYNSKHPKEKPVLDGISLVLEYQACEPFEALRMPEVNRMLGATISSAAFVSDVENAALVLPPYSFAGNL